MSQPATAATLSSGCAVATRAKRLTVALAVASVAALSACRDPKELQEDGHGANVTPSGTSDRTPDSAQPQRLSSVFHDSASAKPNPPSNQRVRIVVDHPESVSVAAVLDPATQFATSIDEHAQLNTIVVRKMTQTGTVDLSQDQAMDVVFGYRYYDRTKPPGADLVEGQVVVTSRTTVCVDVGIPCLAVATREAHSVRANERRARPTPRCSLEDAWGAALASGIPANAIATANYGFWIGPPDLWEFRVDGHEELTRVIDGATCKLGSDKDLLRAMEGINADSPIADDPQAIDQAKSAASALTQCCEAAPDAKRPMCLAIDRLVRTGTTTLSSAVSSLKAQGVVCAGLPSIPPTKKPASGSKPGGAVEIW